jgi:hypothetical protein
VNDPAALTWEAVLERWRRHAVPLVGVLDREGTPGYQPERWSNPDGSPCTYLYRNPVNDTGRVLALGLVTRTPEVFAAFAIHCFVRSERDNRDSVELDWLAKEALGRADTGRDFWGRNAKHVLPEGHPPRFNTLTTRDWRDWLDAAARRWSKLAADFAVNRWKSELLTPN